MLDLPPPPVPAPVGARRGRADRIPTAPAVELIGGASGRLRHFPTNNNRPFETDEKEELPHRPDAFFTPYVQAAASGEQFGNYFYEADRKNTSTTRHTRRLRAHFHYIVKQRLHQSKYGIDRVRAVLVETLDDARAEQLREAAGRPGVSGNKPPPLFWFTTSRMFNKQIEVRDGTRTKLLPKFLLRPEIIFQRIRAPPARQRLFSSPIN